MTLEPLQYLLGVGSGGLVGFTLGLVGGGGSILAVPLLVYLVGVNNPHVAIGSRTTSRKLGAFSQRDTVGCEHRSWPLSGKRPQASLKPGSVRRWSRSSASS